MHSIRIKQPKLSNISIITQIHLLTNKADVLCFDVFHNRNRVILHSFTSIKKIIINSVYYCQTIFFTEKFHAIVPLEFGYIVPKWIMFQIYIFYPNFISFLSPRIWILSSFSQKN